MARAFDEIDFRRALARRYDLLFERLDVPAADRMALRAARDTWLKCQDKIYTAVGGSWERVALWHQSASAALGTLYSRELLACETPADLCILVRRSFSEVFGIDFSEEEQRVLDLVGKYLPHLNRLLDEHVARLLQEKS